MIRVRRVSDRDMSECIDHAMVMNDVVGIDEILDDLSIGDGRSMVGCVVKDVVSLNRHINLPRNELVELRI